MFFVVTFITKKERQCKETNQHMVRLVDIMSHIVADVISALPDLKDATKELSLDGHFFDWLLHNLTESAICCD